MSTVRIPGAGWEVGEEGAERSPLGATVSETLSLHGLGAGVPNSRWPASAGHGEGSGGKSFRSLAHVAAATPGHRVRPCHYRVVTVVTGWATHDPDRVGHSVSNGSETDKGRWHKGLARFARTLPALTPSHLGNNPRDVAAPFYRNGEPDMPIQPTRQTARHTPPPTCTALRARHGGVQ